MSELVQIIAGQQVLVCGPEGPLIATDRDATDVIGDCLGQGVRWAAVPVARFADGVFVLSTRMAGEIIQKFVNYHIRLAVVGDLGDHLAASKPLRDFVYESNRGSHVWFVADLAELEDRMTERRLGPPVGP